MSVSIDPNGNSISYGGDNLTFNATETGIGVEAPFQRGTADADITVSVPSDFSTLSGALEEVGRYTIPNSINISVNIETGFSVDNNIDLNSGDYSNVTVDSVDSTVAASTNTTATTDFFICNNVKGLTINATFDCSNIDANGLTATNSDLEINGGFINSGSDNVKTVGSRLYANDADFTNAGAHGIHGRRGSFIVARWADCSGSNIGLRAFEGTHVLFRQGVADNCSDSGIRVTQQSLVSANGASANNATRFGALATDLSFLAIRNGFIDGAGELGAYARRGSKILCDRVRIDSAGIGAFGVTKYGMISAHDIEGTLASTYGHHTPTDEYVEIQEGVWTQAGIILSEGMPYADDSWNGHALDAFGLSSNQTITAGTSNKVQFSNINVDDHGNWDSTNHEYEIPRDGIWEVKAQTIVRNTNDGDQLYLYAGTTDSPSSQTTALDMHNANAGDNRLYANRTFDLSRGDTVAVWVENADSDDEIARYDAMTYFNVSYKQQINPSR